MGLCASGDPAAAAARRRNKEIEDELENMMLEETRVMKLLLLGTGNSGKSTILKQFKVLFSGGFTDADFQYFRQTIRKNLLKAFKLLLDACSDFRGEVGELPAEMTAFATSIRGEGAAGKAQWDENFGRNLEALWRNDVVQRMYGMEGKLQLEFVFYGGRARS